MIMDATTWSALAPYAAASGGWLLAFYFMRQVFSGRWIPVDQYQKQEQAAAQWREAFQSERAKNQQVVIPMAEAVLHRPIWLDTDEIPTTPRHQPEGGHQ